jgi:hypothetical protein
MERKIPNFNFMDIKQQFVFLMINEDITIISFISDIVFENIQMREKMVWYVESPIVLRCTCLHWFIYMHHTHLFHSKSVCPSSSLLQGKHLPFAPSPLRLNIFRFCVILSLTQLYRYTPKIFLFSTAAFKYKYRAPLSRIGQEYSAKVAFSIFQSLKRIESLLVRSKLI